MSTTNTKKKRKRAYRRGARETGEKGSLMAEPKTKLLPPDLNQALRGSMTGIPTATGDPAQRDARAGAAVALTSLSAPVLFPRATTWLPRDIPDEL